MNTVNAQTTAMKQAQAPRPVVIPVPQNVFVNTKPPAKPPSTKNFLNSK